MTKNHILSLTWAKAFGDIYCHHASLLIPYKPASIFPPQVIRIGLTIRTNMIQKGKIITHIDSTTTVYLPCELSDDGLSVALNSTAIVDGIGSDSWTSLKGGRRGTPKSYPIKLSYHIEDNDEVSYEFDTEKLRTPYLLSEENFKQLKDGEQIDVEINLDNYES